MMQRLAVPTQPFAADLRRAIQLAAATRADGLQFNLRNEVRAEEFGETARRQLLHEVTELGLTVASTTFPVTSDLADEQRLEARIAALRHAMSFARQLNCPILTTRLGYIPEPDTPAHNRLIEVLEELARHGNRVGTTLCLSTIGNETQRLHEVITRIRQTGPLALDFDPAGCVFSAISPTEAFRHLYELIEHIQGRDGQRTTDGSGVETRLGEGSVSWDELLATVWEADYRGWLTLRRTGGESPAQDIARGMAFLRDLLPG